MMKDTKPMSIDRGPPNSSGCNFYQWKMFEIKVGLAILYEIWLLARRNKNFVDALQRWFWSGNNSQKIPKLEGIVKNLVGNNAQETFMSGEVFQVSLDINFSENFKVRNFLLALPVFFLTPKGAGIRKKLAESLLEIDSDSCPHGLSKQQIKKRIRKDPAKVLMNMGRVGTTLSFDEKSRGPITEYAETAAHITRDSPAFQFNYTSNTSRLEKKIRRDQELFMNLLSIVPSSLLRYLELKDLLDETKSIVIAYPHSKRIEAALELFLTMNQNEESDITSAADDRIFSVKVLAGSDLTIDELVLRQLDPLFSASGATIRGASLVSVANKILVSDVTADPRRRAVAGLHNVAQSISSKSNGVTIPPEMSYPKETLSVGLLLSGRADSNWYHFLIDTLPRIKHFDDVPDDVPLLVNGGAPESAVELLSLLTQREIVFLDPLKTYEVEKLIIPLGRSSMFDTAESQDEKLPRFSVDSLQFLQSRFRDLFHSGSSEHDVTYLERNSSHRTVRGQWLFRILPKFGRENVFSPEAQDFKSQVDRYQSSKILVIPGGAAMSNMIFAKPSTVTITLLARSSPGIALWSELAKALDTDLITISLMLTPNLSQIHAVAHRSVILTPISILKLYLEMFKLRRLT